MWRRAPGREAGMGLGKAEEDGLLLAFRITPRAPPAAAFSCLPFPPPELLTAWPLAPSDSMDQSSCFLLLSRILSAAVLQGAGVATEPHAVQDGFEGSESLWTKDPLTSISYQINSKSALTWHQARKSCQQQNAELLSITEIHEQTYLTGLTSTLTSGLWIGLNSLSFNSGWQWSGGSPFRYLNWLPEPNDELWIGLNDIKIQMYFEWSDGTPVTFTKWLRGEPSHENNRQEDCAVMKGKDGYWADRACERPLGYICKTKSQAQTSGIVEVETGCQKFCIIVVPQALSAYSLCGVRVISSCFPNVMEIIGTSPGNKMVHRMEPDEGLSDVQNKGTFQWTVAEDVQFTHWNSDMPGRKAGCVAMRTGVAGGLWDVLRCEEKAKFVCKHWAEGVTRPPEPTTTAEPKCPENWGTSSKTSLCFKLFTKGKHEKKTWFESRDFCRALGGDLASINNKEEQQAIWRLVTWMDGSKVDYVAWATGEPNFANDDENCVTMYSNSGFWNDINCGYPNAFICQRHNSSINATAIPTTPSAPGGCKEGWSFYNHKCFKIFGFLEEERKNWQEARKACIGFGGNLASIQNEKEQDPYSNAFAWMLMQTFKEPVWIALNSNLKPLPPSLHNCLVDALSQSTQHGFLSTVTATILSLHIQGTGAKLLWNVFEWVPLWFPLKVLLSRVSCHIELSHFKAKPIFG
ncbi:hypothetical protein CB1_001715007 [Camelus ferus]|nr:hypothetical protein CB1_001715007 [Camelus ferus]